MTARIRLGAIVSVDEAHYCYGLGVLTLRVTGIGSIEQHSDGCWLHLRGHEQFDSGGEGPERFALVCLGAVRVVAQPDGWKP
ncbi:hypothetical protein [Krasilnikovia sp. M28-CT-15]|uniref:hypothetical protein n=1 Tax=Krasilnikovia sp. M28-CT-15 TaxID=3373540 RepID=UPI00399C54B6